MRRMSVPRSFLAQVIRKLQPLDVIHHHVGCSCQRIFEVALEREEDSDIVLPVSALATRAGQRRLTHYGRGFQLIAFNCCLRERGSVGASKPWSDKAEELAANQINLQFNRLLFLRAWRRAINRPFLSTDPGADKGGRRRILRSCRQLQRGGQEQHQKGGDHTRTVYPLSRPTRNEKGDQKRSSKN